MTSLKGNDRPIVPIHELSLGNIHYIDLDSLYDFDLFVKLQHIKMIFKVSRKVYWF